MPLDGVELRLIIKRVENDPTLCFKMKWYVARHLRHNFVKLRQPCYQYYALRIRGVYYARLRETSDQAQQRQYNRLDFEAARAQVGFRKDQPGWEQETSKVKMLQEAYEMFQWSEFITDDDVDEILKGAKAHSDAFDYATRVSRPAYYSVFEPISGQLLGTTTRESDRQVDLPRDQDTKKSPQNPEPSYRRSKRKQMHDDTPGVSQHFDASTEQMLPRLYEELKSLREEVSELRKAAQEEIVFREKLLGLCAVDWRKERQFRETFLAEHRASQDALLAELRELREATQGGSKRLNSASEDLLY
ncbi:hypothetical protein F5X99DRAFT_391480 [Biscogniauxia marginata]|nr:hypothetical protein F5X99DRAFT_391480 [Biscogniauxia marginata]